MAKRFHELLATLPGGRVIQHTGDAEITAPISESAQTVQPGGIFVARSGLIVDGHDFIQQAIDNGAAAIVGERDIQDLSVPYAQVDGSQELLGWLAAAYYDFPSRKLTVIGVTGTNGKTTTSTLIHSILKPAFGYISTLAADLGDATADTGLHVTTPSAPEVQAYLARMVENGLRGCILEMTSHGLAQGRLNGIDIDVAVLTNLTHEHLDYHGSFENYRAAKGRMFEMLAASYRKGMQPKVSIINADDPNADYFAAITADTVMTYGMGEGAFCLAQNVQYAADGTQFDFVVSHKTVATYTTALVGEFNVMNCMAAICAASSIGEISVKHLQEGIAAVKGVSGRMERIDEGQAFTAIVDFAHTPDALEHALKTARGMMADEGRLIAVFGSAGLRDVEKRRLMAEVSAQFADMTVLTAEDPRTEPLEDILEMMAEGCRSQGGVEGETFIRVPDRGEAIYQACLMANPADIVISCGKGHEQSMCFGTVEHPWDDRDALRAALRGAPLRTLPTANPS